MKRSLIIPAGGRGNRMGASIPKQFLELNSRPILFYTIEKFLDFDSEIQIILVLPNDSIELWKQLCVKHSFTHNVEIVSGGKERFHSVKNGLVKALGDVVAVHDSVRPFVSINVIEAAFQEAEKTGAAIPIVSPKDSIRVLKNGKWLAVDRSKYAMVQTPQVFKKEILDSAYKQDYKDSYTDDASVVEASGTKVFMVEGNYENVKITTQMDLRFAEILLNQ